MASSSAGRSSSPAAKASDNESDLLERTARTLPRAHPQVASPVRHFTDGEEQSARTFRDRVFGRYLFGFGLSLLGDQIWFIALAWAASRLDSAVQASIVLTAGSAPRAVLILLGGTLADRWGALRVILLSQTVRVALMAAATAAALLVDPTLWLLAAIALSFGVIDAAHMPAAGALPPQLLAREDLPAGQALVQTLERVTTIMGAPIGGFIVATGGLSLATALNAALFCAALIVLRGLLRDLSLRTADPRGTADNPDHTEGTWRSLRRGLRYVSHEPILGSILLVVTVLNMAVAAPLNIGVMLLATTRDWGANGFGWIIGGFGFGAVAGALSVVRVRPKKYPAAIGLLWVAAGSLCIAAIGLSTTLPVAVTLGATLGFTSGPASALLLGVVQARTDHAYLGRVMALVTFSAFGMTPISYTAFGILTETINLTGAFLICAATELTTVLIALSSRTVRTAKLAPWPPAG